MTIDIQVTTHPTISALLDTVTTPLYIREWQNCIPLGIYPSYLTPSTAPPRLQPAALNEDGSVFILLTTPCIMACKTPSYGPLGLYACVDPSSIDPLPHIVALCDVLFRLHGTNVPRAFNGDIRLSRPFADAVAARLGARVAVEHLYIGAVLTAASLSADIPRAPLPVLHTVRKAVPGEHTALLVSMYGGMFLETRGQAVLDGAAMAVVDKAVATGHVWAYFVDGEPVAAAFLGRPTRSGKSVTCVYGRREYRGRGYTQTLMDTLCKALLEDEGLGYLALFFEDGSTAARIYRRVGFGKEGEYVQANLALVEKEGEGEGEREGEGEVR